MGCTQIYDFIQGTTFELSPLLSQHSKKAERSALLLPAQETEDLIKRHVAELETLNRAQNFAETCCARS